MTDRRPSPIPAARSRSAGATGAGRCRRAARRRSGSGPLSGCRSPTTRSSSVVLPAPEGPTITVRPCAGMANEAWSRRRRASPWLKTTSSKRIDSVEVRHRLAAARLDLGRGRGDRLDQRPVRALPHHHLLQGPLRLRQVVHHPSEQEHHHQHRRERHLQQEQAEEEADPDHDRQQGLLQRRQGLLADHLTADRPLEPARLVGDQCVDVVLPRHRLQRLGGRELRADGRDQARSSAVWCWPARREIRISRAAASAQGPGDRRRPPACQEIDRAMPR